LISKIRLGRGAYRNYWPSGPKLDRPGRCPKHCPFGQFLRIPCSQGQVKELPRRQKSAKVSFLSAAESHPRVCVYSFHPIALSHIERLLASDRLPVEARRLASDHVSDPDRLQVPPATVYVIEAHGKGRADRIIAEGILAQDPEARLLIVLEKCEEGEAFPLLQLGVKGLVCYSELDRDLGRAVRELAQGGYWVTRLILSRFVDTTLAASRRPRLISGNADLSRREREVHEMLMENFSNKEIARRLKMGERTVKFHVSNLLGKHGVKRRADLILLSSIEQRRA